MSDKSYSISMSRILGICKKDRVRVNTQIERELIDIVRANTLDIADTLNVALEKHLRDRRLLTEEHILGIPA